MRSPGSATAYLGYIICRKYFVALWHLTSISWNIFCWAWWPPLWKLVQACKKMREEQLSRAVVLLEQGDAVDRGLWFWGWQWKSRDCAAPSPGGGWEAWWWVLVEVNYPQLLLWIGFLIFLIFHASFGFLCVPPAPASMRSEARWNAASLANLAPLCTITYSVAFCWSCSNGSYNY